MKIARQALKWFAGRMGYGFVRQNPDGTPMDFGPRTRETIASVREYTMTSAERVAALCDAVEYIVSNEVPGSIVECGVWRGGSMMAVARTLKELGCTDRELYLFDTFEGMSPPTDEDRSVHGESAAGLLHEKDKDYWLWCRSPLSEVKASMERTGYDASRIHFVKGMVESTLPQHAPEKIALLRLDTDWYESTKHELVHLWPRLQVGGVLILDDYGHWEGARKAVDEYFAASASPVFLHRIDESGRVAIKVGDVL